KDFVNLEFNLPANTTGTIEIMDIAGKVVYSEKSDTYYNQVKKINFGQVAAGTYIVKLTTGNGIVSKQFTVIK
ncbi:MAG TPA: T9SS type A sorting domain-containing protein, partial [Saprospiraceae bacterium]|nr:T9SS type A sorting domain-containing protein [Saprospiraceae bacterium]